MQVLVQKKQNQKPPRRHLFWQFLLSIVIIASLGRCANNDDLKNLVDGQSTEITGHFPVDSEFSVDGIAFTSSEDFVNTFADSIVKVQNTSIADSEIAIDAEQIASNDVLFSTASLVYVWLLNSSGKYEKSVPDDQGAFTLNLNLSEADEIIDFIAVSKIALTLTYSDGLKTKACLLLHDIRRDSQVSSELIAVDNFISKFVLAPCSPGNSLKNIALNHLNENGEGGASAASGTATAGSSTDGKSELETALSSGEDGNSGGSELLDPETLDTRYYQQAQIDEKLATIAPSGTLNWNDIIGVPESYNPDYHDHDTLYYSKQFIDQLLATNLSKSASVDHQHDTLTSNFVGIGANNDSNTRLLIKTSDAVGEFGIKIIAADGNTLFAVQNNGDVSFSQANLNLGNGTLVFDNGTINMGNGRIANHAMPTNDNDVATKSYVDQVVVGNLFPTLNKSDIADWVDADYVHTTGTEGIAGAKTFNGTVTFNGSTTINSGVITGITDIAISDGGTGASTAAAARTNLGISSAATLSVGTGAGTIAAGDHTHSKTDVGLSNLTNDAQLAISQNLADLANATTARTNLGLGNSATKDTGTIAGTIATGDHSHTKGDIGLGNVTNDAQLKVSANLSDIGDSNSARNNLGLDSMAVQDANNVIIGGGTLTSVTINSNNFTSTGINDNAATTRINLIADGNIGLNTASPTVLLDANGTIKALKFVGDGSGLSNLANGVLGTTIDSNEIVDGAIVNADVNDAAAIATSKLSGALTAVSGHGLGSLAAQDSTSISVTGGSITGITDIAVADGGTGASTAATARTNLGLAIGTNVQAYSADVNDLADGSLTATKVQYGNLFITTAGSNGQLWSSDGTGAGTWSNAPSLDPNDPVEGSELDGTFASTGLLVRTGAATYSTVTNNSSNWDTAHSDRLKWDGGSSGLTAATGRTSLGLGSLATQASTAISVSGGSISGTAINATALDVSNDANFTGTVTAGFFVGDGAGLSNIPAGTLGTTIDSNEIVDGAIVNADVNDAAAISTSKLSGALTDVSGHGLGSLAAQDSTTISVTGGSISGITDLAIADGGTAASTAANARTNLGLAIGTDVQSYDGNLADLADGSLSASAVEYGSLFINSAGTNGHVWTSDGSGVGGWQSLSGDSLGNHTAAQDLDLAAFTLVGNGGTTGLAIDANGNIGLDTNTPQTSLHVNDDSNNADILLTVDSSGTTKTDGLYIGLTGTASGFPNKAWIWNYENEAMAFGSNDLERMTLDANGDIGIGTTTPAERLHVDGNIAINNTNYLSFQGGSYATSMRRNGSTNGIELVTQSLVRIFIADAGNIGIGTSIPNAPLDMGTLKFDQGNGNGNAAAGPDIYMNANGLLAADDSIFLNIDSNNDSTNAKFSIRKNATTTAGAEIYYLNEDGNGWFAGNVTATAFVGDGAGLTNIPAGVLGTTIDSSEIVDGSILNADVNDAAAIATSKLSGALTAVTGHGLGSLASQDSTAISVTGGSISGITDISVADGGTGASTAANARTNLGLVIGTHVQAYDANLDDLALDGILSAGAVEYGDLFITTAGTNGDVWTSDGSGVGGWQATSGDDLGNHTATQKIDLATYRLVGNGGSNGIAIDANGTTTMTSSNSPNGLNISGSNAARLSQTIENTDTSAGSLTEYAFLATGTDAVSNGSAKITSGKIQQWTATASTRDGYLAFSTRLDNVIAEHMRIDSDGNVGIGVTAPQVPLHIDGGSDASVASDTGGYLLIGDTTGDNVIIDNNEIMARNNGAADKLSINLSGGDVAIGGSSTFIIKDSDLVGIGTSTPDSRVVIDTDVGNNHVALKVRQEDTTNNPEAVVISNTGSGSSVVIRGSGPDLLLNAGGIIAAEDSFSIDFDSDNDSTTAKFSVRKDGNTASATELFYVNEDGNAWVSGIITAKAFMSSDGTGLSIDGNGKVGIGTTTPQVQLHIVAEAAVPTTLVRGEVFGGVPRFGLLRSNGTKASPTNLLLGDLIGNYQTFGYGATGYAGAASTAIKSIAAENFTDTAIGAHLVLSTADLGTATLVERMRIDANGNVGIGTTSPHTIYGTGMGDPPRYISFLGDGAGNSSAAFLALGNPVANPGEGTTAGIISALFPGQGTTQKSRRVAYIGFLGNGSTAGAIGGMITFKTKADNDNTTGLIERMRIDANGNVGIGTTTPTTKIDIVNDSNSSVDIFKGTTHGSTARFILLRANGTISTPTNIMSGDILGTIGMGGYATTAFKESTAKIKFIADEDFTDTALGTHIEFNTAGIGQTSNSQRMRITANGYVRIGTGTPAERLHVDGNIAVTTGNYLSLSNGGIDTSIRRDGSLNGMELLTNSTTRIFIADDGNVGFGTSTPTAPLDLGTLKFDQGNGNAAAGPDMYMNSNGLIAADSSVFLSIDADNDSTTAKFSIQKDANTSAGTEVFYINEAGDGWMLGTLVQASDERLKTDITALTGSLQRVVEIEGVHYHWRDQDRQKDLQTGLIAQQLQGLFPELVIMQENGFYAVNYIGLIPHLIEALKSQQEMIQGLEDEQQAEKAQRRALVKKQAALTEENVALRQQVQALKKQVSQHERQIVDIMTLLCQLKPNAAVCQAVQ